MSRESRPVKVQQWAERLERFARAGQTVAQFCQHERVSQPSFYQWKKKLAGQASQPSSHANSSPSAFRTVELVPTSQSATTIRLANGIEIELGGDLRVVQAVVKQLIELPDGATLAAGGRSC
jgi:hypothetical protein